MDERRAFPGLEEFHPERLGLEPEGIEPVSFFPGVDDVVLDQRLFKTVDAVVLGAAPAEERGVRGRGGGVGPGRGHPRRGQPQLLEFLKVGQFVLGEKILEHGMGQGVNAKNVSFSYGHQG